MGDGLIVTVAERATTIKLPEIDTSNGNITTTLNAGAANNFVRRSNDGRELIVTPKSTDIKDETYTITYVVSDSSDSDNPSETEYTLEILVTEADDDMPGG